MLIFQALKDRNGDYELVAKLLEYVESTWLQSIVWSLADISLFMRSVRTNNDVEGWYHRLNARAVRANLPLYTLIHYLHAGAEFVDLQVRLVSENKMCRLQRASYRHMQYQIFQFWDEFNAGERTVSQLLHSIGRLYDPQT